MLLTKTNLLDHLQCPRKLWLSVHEPNQAAQRESSHERRALDGRLVEERARANLAKYQPSGASTFRWLPASEDKAADAQAAKEAMAKQPSLAFVEVAMHAHGLYARADALLPNGDGSYALLETKASTFPMKKNKEVPDKPEEHHVQDVAIQAWVAKESGIELSSTGLNLLDNRWRYPGDDDYEGLFKVMPMNEHTEEMVTQVPIWLKQAQETVAGPMPSCTTGAQCKKPYPCPFVDTCKAMEPAPEAHPIELLPDMAGKTLAKKLKAEKGYVSLLQPSPDEFRGAAAELFRRMQQAHATGLPVRVPGAEHVLKNLPYPRYYFDFEGIDLAVPRWEGVRPYEQMPFQWSCHVERAPGVFEHYAFLDVSGGDPSLACMQRLKEVIAQDNGPILVYYQTYEKGRLKELAERHPEWSELMYEYIERLVDLHPLVKDHYYHPKMCGSFSIKKVLPTIAPDLDYSELEVVQDGTAAQLAYLNYCFSAEMTQSERETLRQRMLSYCEQDTWAMVEVAYFLEDRGRPGNIRPAPDLLLGQGHTADIHGLHAAAVLGFVAPTVDQEQFEDVPL